MLELEKVHTFYKKSHILQGISLSVEENCVVGLLGRNGMGKTTTVRSIIGFVPPRMGRVRFLQEDITGLPPYRVCKMGIALVPQGRRIFVSLSVRENLLIGERCNGWSLEKIYSLFPILKAREKHKGKHLSGGEQQMLCIGRALLTNPKFVLMDEPSEGLAPLIVQEIGRVVSQLKEKGLAILLVEQNLNLALAVSDFVYVLYHGQIVYDGTAKDLSGNDKVQSDYIGVAKRDSSPI
jgi:branched-chain amino acid transport system ATP-binding protein